MKAQDQFPLVIKRGGVSVRIYRTQTRGYATHQVCAYLGRGQRTTRTFADLEEAKREAVFLADRIATGDVIAAQLTAADRIAYAGALEKLKPTGVSLDAAVSAFAEAMATVGTVVRMRAACSEYAERHPADLPVKLVPEVVEEMIEQREKDGMKTRSLQDLRFRLGKFGKAFNVPIANVTGEQITAWLDGMTLGQQSKLNFVRVLSVLFSYAIEHGYLPRKHDEFELVKWPKVKSERDTLLFTPEQFRRLLGAARDRYLPALVLGGFCGLRTAELERIDWSAVHLAERFVEVKAGVAKTKSRRVVPLCDAAVAWLTPLVQPQGRVWSGAPTTIVNEMHATARRAGVEWVKNGLRHGFCSYRLAETKNAAQTAFEAGNSAAMIHRHYAQLVQPEAAAQWFSIMPEPKDNVVPMPSAATA